MGTHFLCLRRRDCSRMARRLAERCCAFPTCSAMRFAFASTSPGEAPAQLPYLTLYTAQGEACMQLEATTSTLCCAS